MTDEQKDILISKMLDAHSSLSVDEMDMILGDDELKDIYEISSAVHSAFVRQPELNMTEEWNQFRPRILRKPMAMSWLVRIAAIFLGVILASSILVKVLDRILTHDSEPAIAKTEIPAEVDQTIFIPMPEIDTSDSQSQSIKPVVIHTSVKTEDLPINNPAETEEPTEEIDLDEYLRVQQARIDNDLALQNAEIYEDEFNNLIPLLDMAGAYNESVDNAIMRVILQ